MASATQCRSFYPYDPSLALAAVGIGLFAVLSGVHATRMLLTTTWDNVFFVLGGLCQTTGYIARAYSTQNVCDQHSYAAQAILLLLGPTLLMFTVTLSHTAFLRALHADDFCWVPIRFQRPIYLGVNLACFIIQLAGGIELGVAQTRHIAETGSKLKIAAYVIQMVFWGYILAENTTVMIRLGNAIKRAHKASLTQMSSMTNNASGVLLTAERFPHFKRWSQLIGLAISIIGFGRNLMRLTELGVAFLQNNEWTGYAFDGFQMVVVMGVFAIWYLPGKIEDVERTRRHYHMVEMEIPNGDAEAEPRVSTTDKPSTPSQWV